MAEPWFGRKRIGWGWGPRTWQGWAVSGTFVAAVAALAMLAENAA